MKASQAVSKSIDDANDVTGCPKIKFKPEGELCDLLVEWNFLRQELRYTNEDAQFERLIQRIQEIQCRVEAQGILHKKTGFPGMEFFPNLLEHMAKLAKISCSPLGLVLVGIKDFDLFKSVYGIGSTRDCLKMFACSLNRAMKDGQDFVVHWKEDVFAILTPHGSFNWVFYFLDELRKNLEGLTIPYPGKCCYSEVKAVFGAVLADSALVPNSLESFVIKAEEAYEWGKLSGSGRILTF